ncbi:hypothetical protein JHD50_11380 [Sulfurimonas sp. MAG313]|nr:hypothetical protein [Sulfurimonas sp. MAG313]MDF1881890.1 hypothetical protein [Sulfurimonas sp. MAG313]
MKYIIFISLFLSILQADIKTSLYHLYQDKQYEDACKQGLKVFQQYRKDEEFVSLYAFSCLNADQIDRLAIPISILKNSEEARSNAAYFSVILMQKKLLFHALLDAYKLTALKLPKTDHVLSTVYELYSKESYARKRSHYSFIDPNNEKISYKLYIKNGNQHKKMVIEEYYDTIMTHRHEYW